MTNEPTPKRRSRARTLPAPEASATAVVFDFGVPLLAPGTDRMPRRQNPGHRPARGCPGPLPVESRASVEIFDLPV